MTHPRRFLTALEPGTVAFVGTWGEGAFDNDTAADWAGLFDDADGASGIGLIEDALERAARTPADSYLRSRDSDQAVAAAELVAYIADRPVADTAYGKSAFEWADRADPLAGPQLISLALRALARVTGEHSELADLWDEEPSTWRASMAELMTELQDASSD